MAEHQRCEELVPNFKDQSAKSIDKLINHPKYKEIAKSKDFERFKKEAYKNLVATKWDPGNSCKAKISIIEKNKF